MTNRTVNRRAWTSKEDQQLISIINQLPFEDQASLNWKLICEKFNQNMSFSSIFKRQTKQCRQRWNNCLKPGLKQKKVWTHKEKLLLFKYYKIYGQKWCKISEYLPGRSDNNVKNYFYSSVRKLLRKFDKNISLYNRKIRAKKYQLTKITKITQNCLDSASEEKKQHMFKLLRPITKEAINKLLLLAQSKHTHKVQVTDDLEFDLILKVRARLINFLYENELLQPIENDHEQKCQDYKQQSQIQQEQLQDDSLNLIRKSAEDASVNNLVELQKFIEDLYEITTHTKRKKNGTFALGNLSEKQIQGIIKTKKKNVFKNKNLIRKELEQQHKNIVPSTKTIRNLNLGKEGQEDKISIKRIRINEQSLASRDSILEEPMSQKIVEKHKKIQKVTHKKIEKSKSSKESINKGSKSQYEDLEVNDNDISEDKKPVFQVYVNGSQNYNQAQISVKNPLQFSNGLEVSGLFQGNKQWCKNICIDKSVEYGNNNPVKNESNFLNIFKSSNLNDLSLQIPNIQNTQKDIKQQKIFQQKYSSNDKAMKKANHNKIDKLDKGILSIRLKFEEQESFFNKIPKIQNNVQKSSYNPLANSFGCFEINLSQEFPNLQSSLQFPKGSQNALNFASMFNNVEIEQKNKSNIDEDFLLRSASMYNQPLLRINQGNEEDSLCDLNNSRVMLNVSNNYGLGQSSMKYDLQ